MFEIGGTYKFMVDKNFDQPSIYTITIEEEDDIFIRGTDIKGSPRGIKKEAITDWIKIEG
jgi:hypothetical protein